MRIVSLTCSNTEIVCALACGNYLVGVDDYSDFPEDIVASLPRVGPDLNVDIDRVASLKPDLVLASLTVPGHEKVVEGLKSAGLRYIAPEPHRLDDVYRNIIEIGELLGVSGKAEQVVCEMVDRMVSAELSQHSPTLLIQWWPKPVIAPGQLSWTEDLILAAGFKNPIGDREVMSTPLSDEEVLELNPDVVVISWCGVDFSKYRPKVIYRNPLWQETNFVKNKNVFRVSEAYLGRPSPRLVDGLMELKKIYLQLEPKNRKN